MRFSLARSLLCWASVTLKIETIPGEQSTTVRLSGRLRAECLSELRTQIQASGRGIVLEMDEVRLVDVEVVRFLSACEAQGIRILRCPAYIREWMVREQQSESRG
jgi:hypothetical protein